MGRGKGGADGGDGCYACSGDGEVFVVASVAEGGERDAGDVAEGEQEGS